MHRSIEQNRTPRSRPTHIIGCPSALSCDPLGNKIGFQRVQGLCFPPKGEGSCGGKSHNFQQCQGTEIRGQPGRHQAIYSGSGPALDYGVALVAGKPWSPRSHLFCVDQELWDSVPAPVQPCWMESQMLLEKLLMLPYLF